MKAQIVQTHKVENDQIVPVHKSKLILEASERYEIFQEKFLDSGLQIQTTFEEKNSELILAFIQSSRPISEINYLPKPVVICTATLIEGSNKIISATADAPTSFTAPYKAAETMALTRLFDRLGIPSIVHEHEIGETKVNSSNWQDGSTDSIPLTGTNELPVDLEKIPSREDVRVEIDSSSPNTQVQSSEPVVETEVIAEEDTQVQSSEPVVETEVIAEEDTQVQSSEPVVEAEVIAEEDTQVQSSEPVVEAEVIAEEDTQVQSSEPVVEANIEFSLTSNSVEDKISDPEFPSDIPKPFHKQLVAKLKLAHGDDWVNHIPSTKQEAYKVLCIK
ncbi:MAG: hypothetical protein ACI92O_000502 [Colwellia sp.]|jgi:hypothetical protein